MPKFGRFIQARHVQTGIGTTVQLSQPGLEQLRTAAQPLNTSLIAVTALLHSPG